MDATVVGVISFALGLLLGCCQVERRRYMRELQTRREIMAWCRDKLFRWRSLLTDIHDRATARAIAESLSDDNPKLEAIWR